MQPKKIWANLGVKDVEKTRQFYTALGFKSNEGSNKTNQLTSFLIGDSNFIVHFFNLDAFEEAIAAKQADLSKGNELIFTLWADSIAEADAWAEEVRKAGGKIFSEPAAFGEGYYGFGFADPDGHKWNVFHM